MTRDRFEEIFEATESKWDGDNALQGLKIIAKYIDASKDDILCAAEHDIIYSVDVEDIIEGGITEEDAIALAELNWGIDSEFECLYCFV